VALAPRKIGRAAAEEQPADKVESVAAAMAPIQAPTDMLPPTPSEEPKKPAAVVASDQPSPADLPKSDPAPVESPKPELAKPEVAKPETPVAAVAQPGIDRAVVSSVVGTHRPEVLKCFAEGKKKNGSMKGTLN